MSLNPLDWRCSSPITSGYVAPIVSPFPIPPRHSMLPFYIGSCHTNARSQRSFAIQHYATPPNPRKFCNEHTAKACLGSPCVSSDDPTWCSACAPVYWCGSMGGGLRHRRWLGWSTSECRVTRLDGTSTFPSDIKTRKHSLDVPSINPGYCLFTPPP
jgi:hypothetical protein